MRTGMKKKKKKPVGNVEVFVWQRRVSEEQFRGRTSGMKEREAPLGRSDAAIGSRWSRLEDRLKGGGGPRDAKASGTRWLIVHRKSSTMFFLFEEVERFCLSYLLKVQRGSGGGSLIVMRSRV